MDDRRYEPTYHSQLLGRLFNQQQNEELGQTYKVVAERRQEEGVSSLE
jgi:hypothetical protein